jgi:hypothetical protein
MHKDMETNTVVPNMEMKWLDVTMITVAWLKRK